MKGIKAICLQTTAFHYIDTEYLKEKNIPVTNLRGFSTNAVAEQAFAMIFALARKIPMVLRE
jgi:glycerate dehydrogenase